MTNSASRLTATGLIAFLLGCSAVRADTAASADIILPTDPRFAVFELSNSAGGGTYPSSVGTVLLTFVSKDQRYCRSARIPADRNVVLACRGEGGWKIEATSDISQSEANYPTTFGGGYMQEISGAIGDLMASLEPMGELEIIEAASKGWRDPAPVNEQTYDAGDILRQTAKTYRISKSYVDNGTVRTVYKNASREWTGETSFKTAYVAPYDFRFESTMRDMPGVEANFIAWRDRDGVKTWYNLNPDIGDNITIQDALDTGAGISRDTSGMIPGLIFPGTKLGGDIVRLTSAVRLEDAQVDGFDCFQVQGFRWPNTGRPTTVWIDKESFLIRQVYEEQEIKGDLSKATWSYKPAINVPVDEELLLYGKP